jgi:geranylgeranyl diphosphate synthase, type II
MIQAHHRNDEAAAWLGAQRPVVEACLADLLDEMAQRAPAKLKAAMQGPLMGAGKRLRPLLMLASTAHLTGGAMPDSAVPDSTVRIACLFEIMHAASLIYDDLPCMDDAAERRGQAAVHIEHGESTALLAAISLMNGAYQVLADTADIRPDVKIQLVSLLGRTVGADGLAAGQYYDLHPGQTGAADLLEMRRLKTGILFQSAAIAGALCAGANASDLNNISIFADKLGLAFQLLDDLSDHDMPENENEVRQAMEKLIAEAMASLPGTGPLQAFVSLVFGTAGYELA